MGTQTVQIALLLMLAGCASSGPRRAAASLWEAGNATQLFEQGETLLSPDIRLGWAGDGWRGQAWGHTLDLHATPTGIKGFAANGPVNLTVELGDEATKVKGLFDHQLGALEISAKRIEGRIGRCAYDLRSEDGSRYEGFRSCGDALRRTRVSLSSLGGHPLGAGRLAPVLVLLAR